ncbi:unnamed protein product [Phyllotreta striolata]|uniref:Uncharacterized protein n=1 Tax=Phyllotreta striolata TaxID=444603 RepID=A0A9N9TML7_PHYSR|nr:unnamed protein product [Phyllotreta striolata]
MFYKMCTRCFAAILVLYKPTSRYHFTKKVGTNLVYIKYICSYYVQFRN